MSDSAMTRLQRQLIALGACSEAVRWAGAYATLDEAWGACERGDWMVWLLGRMGTDLSATAEAWRTYCEATVEARAKARAEARRAYRAATTEPRRTYNEAMAEPRRVYADALRAAYPCPDLDWRAAYRDAADDLRAREEDAQERWWLHKRGMCEGSGECPWHEQDNDKETSD